MDIKSDYIKYDAFINIALTNLFTVGKQTKVLNFYNYQSKNLAHLAIMNIASITQDIFGFQIKVNTSLFKFLKLKKLGFERTKEKDIDIEEFIRFIENDTNEQGIFAKIYEEYYKGQ